MSSSLCCRLHSDELCLVNGSVLPCASYASTSVIRGIDPAMGIVR